MENVQKIQLERSSEDEEDSAAQVICEWLKEHVDYFDAEATVKDPFGADFSDYTDFNLFEVFFLLDKYTKQYVQKWVCYESFGSEEEWSDSYETEEEEDAEEEARRAAEARNARLEAKKNKKGKKGGGKSKR